MTNLLQKMNFFKKYIGLYWQSKLYGMANHGFFKGPVSIPDSRYAHSASHANHPVFQALSSGFVHQFNEAACSVASTATVLNAGKTILNHKTVSPPITQQEILQKVDAANWSDRVSPEGFRSSRGLPLDHLGMAVQKAFSVFEIPCESVVTVPLFDPTFHLEAFKKELWERLVYFQQNQNCFLIAHFNQGVFVKGLHLPHISPVGCVDMANRMVCILDVDPDVKEPYWVSFDTFWKGVSWRYSGIIQKHGYEGGGYIWIKLKKPESLQG